MDVYSNNKLPVFQILSDVIILTLKHSFTLFRFGAPFIIFSLLIFYDSITSAQNTDTFTSQKVLVYIIYLGTLIMAIIGCHRTFLLNSESISNTKTFRWSGRETRFVWNSILIMLCVSLIMWPIMMFVLPLVTNASENDFMLQMLPIILNIFMSYIISRLSLVLPATAIDERDFTISSAWNISSGNSWRLTLLVALLPFTIGLLLNFLPEYDSILYSLITWSAWIIVGVIEIGLLSLSYSYLSKHANKNNYFLQ